MTGHHGCVDFNGMRRVLPDVRSNLRQLLAGRMVLVSVVVVITLGLASALIGDVTRGNALRQMRAETVLAVLQSNTAHMEALEWQAIANKKIPPTLATKFASARNELNRNLLIFRKEAEHPAAVTKIELAYLVYSRAVGQEFILIREGHTAAARALDRSRTDSAGEVLNDLLVAGGGNFRRDARHAATLARIVGWVTPLAAAFAIAFLFMLIVRSRARDAAVESEALRERNSKLREIDRTKDEFVATVSHELRTPLTSIRGYLELMEDEEGISMQGREFLGVIDRNSERLLRLVGDLLFVAQDDAGLLELDLTAVRPRELMEQAVASARPAAEARRITLSAHALNVPDVMGDSGRLSQMLDNLLSNSLKFTPPGGRVDVRLNRDAAGSTVFQFQDTGIGIPKPEQDRLFKRFFRADAAARNVVPGTGLGLSIVKLIAEAHGGSVSVESDEGKGATFRVVLPLSPHVLPAAA
jgi:signal transduction histidine kinase